MIRNRVKQHLLTQLRNGQIAVGKPINLAKVARELGVSATPVREAMSQLEHIGILTAMPHRGFTIPAPSLETARELYQTITELHALALEQSTITKSLIEELKNVAPADDLSLNSISVNDRFHKILLGNCQNKVLMQLIENLEARVGFYEQAYFTDSLFKGQIQQQYQGIIEALEEDNQPTAVLLLKMNWMSIWDHVSQKVMLHEEVRFTRVL